MAQSRNNRTAVGGTGVHDTETFLKLKILLFLKRNFQKVATPQRGLRGKPAGLPHLLEISFEK
jgi:hypothetical protein